MSRPSMALPLVRSAALMLTSAALLASVAVCTPAAQADDSKPGSVTVTSPDENKIKLSSKGLKAYQLISWSKSSTLTSDQKKVQKIMALPTLLSGETNDNDSNGHDEPDSEQAIAMAINKIKPNTCTDPNALNENGAYEGTCGLLDPASYVVSDKFSKDDQANFAAALDTSKLPPAILPTTDSQEYSSAKWAQLDPGVYLIKPTDPSASNDYPLLVSTLFYPDSNSVTSNESTGLPFADGVMSIPVSSVQYRIPATSANVETTTGQFTNLGDSVEFKVTTSIPNYSSQKAGLADKDFYPFFTVKNSYSRNYEAPKLEQVGVYLDSDTGTQLVKDKDYTITSVETGGDSNPGFTIDLNPAVDGKRESAESGHGKNLLAWQGKKLIVKYDVKVKNVDTNADLGASVTTASTEKSGGDATASSGTIKIASITVNTTGKDGVSTRNSKFEVTPSSQIAKQYKLNASDGSITSCSTEVANTQSCGTTATVRTKNGSIILTGLAQGINVNNSSTNTSGDQSFVYHFKEIGGSGLEFNLKAWPVYDPNTPTAPKVMYKISDSTDEAQVENTNDMQLPASADNTNYLESDSRHIIIVKGGDKKAADVENKGDSMSQKQKYVIYAIVLGVVLIVIAVINKIRSVANHKKAVREARELRRRW